MRDLPETATGVLELMPSTDVQIAKFVHQIVSSVKKGEVSALKIQVLMRALEAVSEHVREEIEENVLNEADRYNEKSIELYGARIEKGETNVRYNYLKSGDLEYEELHAEAETANRKLKEREAFLRQIKEPQGLISRHGEPYTAHPPFRTSKECVKVFITHKK